MSAFRFLVVFALVALGQGLAQGKANEIERLKEQLEREVVRRERAETSLRDLGKVLCGREDPPALGYLREGYLQPGQGVVAAAAGELVQANAALGRRDPDVARRLGKVVERAKQPYSHFTALVSDLHTVAKAAEVVAHKQAEELKYARESLEHAADTMRKEGDYHRAELKELRAKLTQREDEWLEAVRGRDAERLEHQREKEELLRQLEQAGKPKEEGDDRDEAAPLPPRPHTEAEIKEHLAKMPVSLTLENAPFEDALGFLRDISQVNVVLAPEVEREFEITVSTKEIPIAEALSRVLATSKAKLGYTIWSGVVYVHPAGAKLPPPTAPGESPLGKKLVNEDRTVDFYFETPLPEALDFVRGAWKLDVQVDPAAKDRVGELQTTLFAFKLQPAQILDLLTLRHGLRWKVAGDAVRIELAPKK